MYETIVPELLRGGSAFIPGLLFQYAHELELEMEDFGLLSALFYCLACSHPLNHQGVPISELQKLFPNCSNSRLSRRLNHLVQIGILAIDEDGSTRFSSKCIHPEPLFHRLTQIFLQNSNLPENDTLKSPELLQKEQEIQKQQAEISRLQCELEQARQITGVASPSYTSISGNPHFVTISNFIAEHTNTILSSLMQMEISKWLDEYGMENQLLLCLLEMCFERKITAPQEITRLVRETREYNITSVEGLENYFQTFVDKKQILSPANYGYDADMMELARFLDMDMKAEARRQLYYKWRNDWGFSQEMILKAGELMSTRTRQGGLAYMDQILSRWKQQQIFTLADVEKELELHRQSRQKHTSSPKNPPVNNGSLFPNYTAPNADSMEIYIPKDVLEELKKNA